MVKHPKHLTFSCILRCASLDGDADRLVYFYIPPMKQDVATSASLQLLDGDKIATLFASIHGPASNFERNKFVV